MKMSEKSKNIFFKGFLLLLLVCPMAVSCYDDSALWDEMEGIKERLDSLETGLNGQIEALSALLKGDDITIARCVKNDNGSYSLTLSDGTEFTVLHGNARNKPLLSYVVESGTKYWAVYDAEGILTPLVDGEGNKLPVSAAVPVVEERDGAYYLVVDGEEYLTGYAKGDNVSVITDYEVNADDTGNIYSVTFVIGDETFTLTVDGYKGFTFMLGSAMAGGSIIKDLYVGYGMTYQITAGLDGVVDYVMQIPDGWRVEEIFDELMNELRLDISAPTEETVAAGAAVASGNLKVMAVIDGGDAMVAKLELSTEPFKTFKTTATNAIIEKRNGVDKFIYGLTRFADYDEAKIFADAPKLLQANAEGVTDGDVNAALATLLGSEIETGVSYVLWAIPAFYETEGENAGYHVKDGLVVKHVFGGSAIHLAVADLTFNNAVLSFNLAGVDSYYGGTDYLTESVYDDILYRINNQLMDPVTAPMSYNGSAFDFPSSSSNVDVEPASESSYVTWVVPVTEGKTVFSTDDIVKQEYTLPGVTAGGAVTVKSGAAEIDCVSVSTELTAQEGTRIYYAFLTARAASRHDDTTRPDYLLKNGTVVEGSSAMASVDGLDPETDIVLFAMATDAAGKYGDVLVQDFKTEKLVFNDLKVTLEPLSLGGNNASCKVSVSGGEVVEYIYWAGRESDEFWLEKSGVTSTEKKVDAQKYIALYPEDHDVRKAMSAYPLTDGVLQMSDLKTESVYHVVVLAKDSEGKFSKAGFWQFTTLSADLGDIVREGSSQWESVKSQVLITWHEDRFRATENSNMSAFYSFDIKVPTDLTAFILCMTDEYFENNPDTGTVEERIIDIERQCTRKYDSGRVVSDENGYIAEPDWIDDEGNTHSGTLLNIYDFYVHGYPTNGFATYFAAGSHAEGNCTSWDAGACSNYSYALEHITKRHSIDYYIQYIKNNRGGYCTKPDVIQKCAQDLFEAYYPYYKDAQPLIYVNNGEALYMENHYASGVDDKGKVMDDVFVVFKDAQGNYYEPMGFEVPNHFK